ncbi:RNA helicase [Propionibacterium ruminifibrarum]|uniref:RNA helicase n=1 Tax=Propionibacterium ruminifibrarum TaxID=1962131 RepID=A0A375HYB8_9ACTN|nr:DEAD/DEAH box helicase [Propionibacterium ruminifibrarum]SPF67268.1 RNA helicase [Propionibacterium ruminifibrarum]
MTLPITDPTATEKTTFADLGVAPPIVAALADKGIEHPFPIQEMAIPIALGGADMIGQARTGTGKTLAFGIPILQRIVLPGTKEADEFETLGTPQALVMTPTRELAMQVADDLAAAAARGRARITTIYGGVGYDDQLKALAEGVDVVVGTPGRLLDLVHRRDLDLSHVSIAVLDEADEMLDLGFLPDVEALLDRAPTNRQTLMFSATMPAVIMSLARSRLNQPVHIRAESQNAQMTVPQTTQFVYQAHDLDKPEIIAKVLQADGMHKMMVFTRTKRAAQRLCDDLRDRGFDAAGLHGDLNQAQREKTMKRFRENKITVLVCTDVAARGIDVDDVTHVVNYEVPDSPEQYVHRIGRTGRAGHEGIAVTLVDWQDVTRWKVINKALDLDFHDPVETYSTSEHLFTDLDIPAGTKGRLPGARSRDEVERRHRAERAADKDKDRDGTRGHRGRGDGKHGDGKKHRGEKKDGEKKARDKDRKDRPRRKRRRTRNGHPVDRESTE